MTVSLVVNNEERNTYVGPMVPLARVLREEFHLTGTKVACGEGFCGSCTVFVDDKPMKSCLLPVGMVQGRSVRTIESIAPGNSDLNPIQQAMLDLDVVQCGMCFPGMVVTLTALYERQQDFSREDVQAELVGNICRCTGYDRIVEAALLANRRRLISEKGA